VDGTGGRINIVPGAKGEGSALAGVEIYLLGLAKLSGTLREILSSNIDYFEKTNIKNFQVRMPIDWKLRNELSEV